MSVEYDQITAFHYSAFRPSLHFKILNDHFEDIEKFNVGLDVGCGTGHSSIALSNFCEQVIGIDPSKEMLNKSIKDLKVEYTFYDKKNLDFVNDHFEIITFAGSLYYAKSQHILNETIRVSKQDAKILVYDFEIILDDILSLFNFEEVSDQIPGYNHEENFSGLDQKNLILHKKLKKSVPLEISASNLSHLLLSSKDNYSILCEIFGVDNLYNKISQKLISVLETEKTIIPAMTYSTVYSVIK
jgi:ubiquinone/menaquinone biosynthesis C-methylase UbiE